MRLALVSPVLDPPNPITFTKHHHSVGSAVLQQCISHPEVTSIVALTRRPLEVQDPKLESVIVKDFLTYEDDVVEKMKGSVGCIW